MTRIRKIRYGILYGVVIGAATTITAWKSWKYRNVNKCQTHDPLLLGQTAVTTSEPRASRNVAEQSSNPTSSALKSSGVRALTMLVLAAIIAVLSGLHTVKDGMDR